MSQRGIVTRQVNRSSFAGIRRAVVLVLLLASVAVVHLADAGRTQAVRADDAFVAGFEDLPLMVGLTIAEEGSMRFATGGGRIVEAWAVGQSSEAAVLAFYRDTLPQLGWRAKGELSSGQPAVFTREGEQLIIAVTVDEAQVMVSFFLRPAGG
jgi:hypothetical protein